MDVLKALVQTIVKMFAADLWLSLTAIAVVAVCWAGLASRVLPAAFAPYLLGAGVMAALVLGVARGARAFRR